MDSQETNKATQVSWFYNHRVLTGAALVLLVVLILGILDYADTLKETQKNLEPVPTLRSEQSTETAGWKTYWNDKYGFSFNYPDIDPENNYLDSQNFSDVFSFSLPAENNTTQAKYINFNGYRLTNSSFEKEVQTIWQINKEDNNPNIVKTLTPLMKEQINNINALSFVLTGSFSSDVNGSGYILDRETKYLYFQTGDTFVEVNFPLGQVEFESMVKTLKVVPVRDSTWVKKVTNYGFEISYPSDFQVNTGLDSILSLTSGTSSLKISEAGSPAPNSKHINISDIAGEYIENSQYSISAWFANDFMPSKYIRIDLNGTKDSFGKLRQILATLNYPISTNINDWNIFTNSQYGFEFKYPKNLFQEVNNNLGSHEEDKRVFGASGFKGGMSIEISDHKFDPNNIQGIYGTYKASDLTAYNIGPIKGYGYSEGDAGCGWHLISGPINDKTIKIGFGECELYESEHVPLIKDTELVNQILSTFKFTQ